MGTNRKFCLVINSNYNHNFLQIRASNDLKVTKIDKKTPFFTDTKLHQREKNLREII